MPYTVMPMQPTQVPLARASVTIGAEVSRRATGSLVYASAHTAMYMGTITLDSSAGTGTLARKANISWPANAKSKYSPRSIIA